MKGMFAVVLAAGLLTGCAVSKDGLGLVRTAPSASQIARTKDQLQSNLDASAAAHEAAAAGTVFPGILVIGTTGPFRTIDDKDRAGFYAAYVKMAAEWHPGLPPAMDATTFQQKLAGWASVQTFSIPGVVSSRIRVLVPSTLAHDTKFASAAGSVMFGTTGDLVVAKGDRDGLLWLEGVLCRDGADYRACTENYLAGIFDENTGEELARDRKPKRDGARVDVTSYVRLSKDPEHHTAHDLDMHVADQCDCHRPQPGSAQSAVPTREVEH